MRITLVVDHEKAHGEYTFEADNWIEAKEKILSDLETAQYIVEELEKSDEKTGG